jgi:hypothetical protein
MEEMQTLMIIDLGKFRGNSLCEEAMQKQGMLLLVEETTEDDIIKTSKLCIMKFAVPFGKETK